MSEMSLTTSNDSPLIVKKICTQAQTILMNVLQVCKSGKEKQRLSRIDDDIPTTVSYLTGLPSDYIASFIYKNEFLDPTKFNNEALLKSVLVHYRTGNLLTLKQLYETYKNMDQSTTLTESVFERHIYSRGYEYVKNIKKPENEGYMIMEDPKLTFERFHYLKRITNSREKHKRIYFIDELKLDISDQCPLSILYMMSEHTFKYLLCSTGYSNEHPKWVIDVVLPRLEPGSVIVLDSNFLNKTSVTSITKYHCKTDMIRWLNNHYVPCSLDELSKAELFQLIERCKSKPERFQIDSLIKASHHTPLRIPKNYYDYLSMSSIMLKCLMYGVPSLKYAKQNKWNLAQLKNILTNYFENNENIVHKCLQFIQQVEKRELQILKYDIDIEKELDLNYTIDPDSVLSSSCNGLIFAPNDCSDIDE